MTNGDLKNFCINLSEIFQKFQIKRDLWGSVYEICFAGFWDLLGTLQIIILLIWTIIKLDPRSLLLSPILWTFPKSITLCEVTIKVSLVFYKKYWGVSINKVSSNFVKLSQIYWEKQVVHIDLDPIISLEKRLQINFLNPFFPCSYFFFQ